MDQNGTIEVDVRMPPGHDPLASGRVSDVVESFGRALALGMFPPGSLSTATRLPAGIHWSFEVVSVPEHAFRVLNGMLAYHHGTRDPIASWAAYPSLTPTRNLCATSESSPELAIPYPFPMQFEPDTNGTTPPLIVSIELGSAPDAQLSQRLVSELRVWHDLLQGGYPGPDFEAGESGTSPPSIRFNNPRTLVYSVEMWNTGYEAFVPLLRLIRRWSDGGVLVADVDVGS